MRDLYQAHTAVDLVQHRQALQRKRQEKNSPDPPST